MASAGADPVETSKPRFAFGDLSTETTVSKDSPELRNCTSGVDGYLSCKLSRSSFGGIVIQRSLANFAHGKLQNLDIEISRFLFDDAFKVLSEKYGAAKLTISDGQNKFGGPRTSRTARWHFAQGTLILFAYSDEPDAKLSFCCANLPKRKPPTPDF
jgi:hypothetical protein